MRPLSFTAAQHAIYIDFESLKTEPPQPALLGVLIGPPSPADGKADFGAAGAEDLEQLILDEALAPARVARRQRTRAISISDAVETVVRKAAADNLHIVGWSNFDRDRLVDARPDLRAEIEDHYVNALKIARPWRIKVHPSFKVDREDQFSPKHTLDKYAVLAAYPDARAMMNAQPAKWIRHMRDQLHANSGRYRRTTSQAKRDWHKLLDYNRHDLLALRHIVLMATRELECWRAYERTRFCVDEDRRRICFMAGSRNARLDALLARRNATRWAFITAWNPGSQPLSAAENARRHAELVREVERLGLRFMPGEGIAQDPAWKPERSLMILGISRGRAESLGRRFGQLSIVVGRRGEPSELLSTADTPRASSPSAPVR